MRSLVAKYWSLLVNAVRYDGIAVLAWRVLRQVVSPLGSLGSVSAWARANASNRPSKIAANSFDVFADRVLSATTLRASVNKFLMR